MDTGLSARLILRGTFDRHPDRQHVPTLIPRFGHPRVYFDRKAD